MSNINLPMLHVVPEYPDGHSQVTPPTVSRHVPPALQLVLVQSGKSETSNLYFFVVRVKILKM